MAGFLGEDGTIWEAEAKSAVGFEEETGFAGGSCLEEQILDLRAVVDFVKIGWDEQAEAFAVLADTTASFGYNKKSTYSRDRLDFGNLFFVPFIFDGTVAYFFFLLFFLFS